MRGRQQDKGLKHLERVSRRCACFAEFIAAIAGAAKHWRADASIGAFGQVVGPGVTASHRLQPGVVLPAP